MAKKTIFDLINEGNLDAATELASSVIEETGEEEPTTNDGGGTQTGDSQPQSDTGNVQISASQEQGEQPSEEQPQPQSQGDGDTPPEPQPKEEQPKKKPQPKLEKYIKPACYELVKAQVLGNVPTYLSGDAGTGKNTMVKNIADELQMNFYFSNAVQEKYQFEGFVDANGKYVPTQFYEFCINGGLFFFDEIDASDPSVLVGLNAAIDNRYFDFPGVGRVQLNPECRFICAGNTLGQGANLKYNGRNKLDSATLDRFTITIVDYDKKVEEALAKGDKELSRFTRDFRQACKKCGLDAVVGYRKIIQVKKLQAVNVDLKDIMQIVFTNKLERDDLQLIWNKMSVADNQYYNTLKELI